MVKADTKDEFDTLTHKLASEIQLAHGDYLMTMQLSDLSTTYEREMQQSPVFWQKTIGVFAEACVLRLARLYDKQKETLDLRSWLMLIDQHPEWITKFDKLHHPQGDQRYYRKEELAWDLKSVSEKAKVVKRLVVYRNNFVGHTNWKNALKTATGQPTGIKLTYGDLDSLLDRAKKLIDKYSMIYNNSSWSMSLPGADDVKFVLESIQKRLCSDA